MNKKGSALLLSLLIVSALLSSVLYISALSLRQMSQSVNTDNALVAFYSAESSNEQVIYKIRKHLYSDISELQAVDEYMPISNSLFTREVTYEMYGITIGIYENQFFQIDMFDLDNLSYESDLSYLDIDWDDNCDGDSWIEFTSNYWKSGNSVEWLTGVDQDHIKKSLLNNPPLLKLDNVAGENFKPENSYQFRLKALYCDIYNLSIVAYNESGEIIPFKNIFNIKSVGEYPANSNRSNKQALSVSVRKFSPLSGLFDYVIFSEESLVKDIGAYSAGWFTENLFISTVALKDAHLGENYIDHLNAVNGISPYRWEIVSGSIPNGINFLEDGTITGNVSGDLGVYVFRVKLTDKNDESVEKNLQINVIE